MTKQEKFWMDKSVYWMKCCEATVTVLGEKESQLQSANKRIEELEDENEWISVEDNPKVETETTFLVTDNKEVWLGYYTPKFKDGTPYGKWAVVYDTSS